MNRMVSLYIREKYIYSISSIHIKQNLEEIVSHSPIDVPVHILIQIEPPRSNQDYGEQITVLYGLSGSAAV